MTIKTIRVVSFLAAGLAMAAAHADNLYSGTWDIAGQAAGTLTIRVSDDAVSAALVGNTGRRRNGHMHGSVTGKRFKVILKLRNKRAQEFQGNITHDDNEAHMDGLLYIDNKPVGNVRFTANATRAMAGR